MYFLFAFTKTMHTFDIMNIISITSEKVTFDNGREIYGYEIMEWLEKNGNIDDFDGFINNKMHMLQVAASFPFINTCDLQHFVEGNPFKYLNTESGNVIISMSDVTEWVRDFRMDEVERRIKLIKPYNPEYSLANALIEVSEKYFTDMMQTYLIWNL